LERTHVPCDAYHRAAHVLKGELIRHDGAPTGSSELDLSFHKLSHANSGTDAVSITMVASRFKDCTSSTGVGPDDGQEDRVNDHRLQERSRGPGMGAGGAQAGRVREHHRDASFDLSLEE